MALVVNTNIAAMTANRNLNQNTKKTLESMERLSTGFRINHAKDDVAGLQISEILRTQVRGLDMALRNTQDGASMLQVAEGSFQSITENIQRIRELTVQAANDTYGSAERTSIAKEVIQRMEDITQIAATSKFNGVQLIDGSQSSFVIQIGANGTSNDIFGITAALLTATAEALGLSATSITVAAGGVFESGANCRAYLATIDAALDTMFSRRSTIGAYQNRMDSIINNIEITRENITASESRIRDLDVAKETTNLTKNQILQQASVSILSQAMQAPQLALNLL